MSTAHLEIRTQHARGCGWKSSPDTYVAVQIVPEGRSPLICLNASAAAARGIEIIYCGEGYSNRRKTDRSMLGAALAKARQLVKDHGRI